jgi:hypothetical protein
MLTNRLLPQLQLWLWLMLLLLILRMITWAIISVIIVSCIMGRGKLGKWRLLVGLVSGVDLVERVWKE